MRKEGYYWVKYKYYNGFKEWLVAYFNNSMDTNYWAIVRTNNIFTDTDFEEINERRLEKPE